MNEADFFRWYLSRFRPDGLTPTRRLEVAALWGNVTQAQLAYDKIDDADRTRTSTLVQAFLGSCYTNQVAVLTWLATLHELGLAVSVPVLRRSYVESYLKEGFAQACLEGHVDVLAVLINHYGVTPELMLRAIFTCLYLTPSSVLILKYLLEDLKLGEVDSELEPELLVRLQAGFHDDGAKYLHARMQAAGTLADFGARPTSPSSPKGRRTSALLQRSGSSQKLKKRVSSRRMLALSALPEDGTCTTPEDTLEASLMALSLAGSTSTLPLPTSAYNGSVLNLSTSHSATGSPAIMEEPEPNDDDIASFIAASTGQQRRLPVEKGVKGMQGLTRASSRNSLADSMAGNWEEVLNGQDRRRSEQAASELYAMW
jgi:hypothetical protein